MPSQANPTGSENSFLKEAGLFVLDILYNAIVIVTLVVLIRSFLISPFRVVGSSMADTLHTKEFIIVNKLVYTLGEPKREDIVVFRPPMTSKYNPKFEETVTTDDQGKSTLLIGPLRQRKDLFYCKAPVINWLWFCQDKVSPGDWVYFQKKNENGAITPSTYQKVIVQPEEAKKGELVFNGDPLSSYLASIYSNTGPEYFIKRIIGIPGDTIKIEEGKVYYKKQGDSAFTLMAEPYLNEQNQGQTYLSLSQQAEFVVPNGHYFLMGDNRNYSNDSRNWITPIDKEWVPFVPRDQLSGKSLLVLWPLQSMRVIEHQTTSNKQ